MPPLFLINVGNTHVHHLLLGDDGAAVESGRLATSDAGRLAIPPGVAAAGACVVPAVRSLLPPSVFWVDAAAAGRLVDFSLADAGALGADRVANAVRLAESSPLPAMVFDFGTAITLEVVDARRRFVGGAILPGRKLMRDVLGGRTALLPSAPFGEPETFGLSTFDAIMLGVDEGAAGAVARLAAEARARLGLPADVPVWAAGGDRAFFAGRLPWLRDGGGFFTERGVAAIWRACQA